VASSPSRRAAAVSRGWRLLSIPARCGGVPRTRRWPQHGALLLWRSGIYEAEAAEAATATAERRADGGAHSARLACVFFKKKQKSSPSANMPLGEYFPECAILDSICAWGSRLPRGALPRTLFPESCTRGRLPRVQLALPRVQPALGEHPVSRSVTNLHICMHDSG
jgi:hypothetical protein